jgi:hypothetical protein
VPNIYRYRSVWTGFSGAPGYTNLYAMPDTTEQVFADAVRAFLADAAQSATPGDHLPQTVAIQGDPNVDVLDVATGLLVDSVPVTPPAVVQGANSTVYAAPAGACINWLTGAVHNGHRVRGRTFFVPLASSAFENNGTLHSSALTNLRTAAAAYIAGSSTPCVWSRPIAGGGGAAFAIASSQVTDKVAILTSRRD